jgi:hypothetical protein
LRRLGGGGSVFPPRELADEPGYSGTVLMAKAQRWYEQYYGNHLKVVHGYGSVPVRLANAIWRMRTITIYGQVDLFVNRDLMNDGVRLATVTATPAIRRAIHRRSAVEPAIGHMKNEGKLRRHWLKGSLGDALNAVLCGAGHNLRMILRAIRLLYVWMLCLAIASARQSQSPYPESRRFAVL